MKDDIQISKLLSLVLRHQPEAIGIHLDESGWTDIKTLLEKMNQHGAKIDFEGLKHVVDTNPKKRFAFNENLNLIRASQGHSVEVDLGYESQKPPQILFHGTSVASLSSILGLGIVKGKRQHVHLSVDQETAVKVGQRHGRPVVLEVLAEEMFDAGYKFFLSDNKVWLTEEVPVQFIRND